MKRILFIAPHSFPIHSSESIVNAKLAFALAEQGYKLDIYSMLPNVEYPLSQTEEKLSKHSNIIVHTLKNDMILERKNIFKLSTIKVILSHLYVFLRTGYIYNGIVIPYKMKNEIEKNIAKESKFSYDVMITRGFWTEIVAFHIKKKYGVKWVANWNDPFPGSKFPPPYGKGPDYKLPFYEEKILNQIQELATFHTFPSRRLRNYMLSYLHKVKKENTAVIPHMAHSALIPKSISKDSRKLRMVHAGNVTAPRNPDNFILAMHLLLECKPEYKNKIECLFIGKFSDDFVLNVHKLKMEENIITLPPKNYFDTIEIVSKRHLSVVIEAICEEGIYLPTKVVDSIQSMVPIFCVSPQKGTQHDLVDQYKIGYYANNESPEEIASQLEQAIVDFENDNLPKIDIDKLNFFENSIIEQYNDILNS